MAGRRYIFHLCSPRLRYNCTEGANLGLALLEREGGGEAVGRVLRIENYFAIVYLKYKVSPVGLNITPETPLPRP